MCSWRSYSATTAEIPLRSSYHQIKGTPWRIKICNFMSSFTSLGWNCSPLALNLLYFIAHQRNIFRGLGGGAGGGFRKWKQVHGGRGWCLAACLLWTSKQLDLNWVLEWKEVVQLGFFHPVSPRQTFFVTHILADLEASRPPDPVWNGEQGRPGSLLHRFLFTPPPTHTHTNNWISEGFSRPILPYYILSIRVCDVSVCAVCLERHFFFNGWV